MVIFFYIYESITIVPLAKPTIEEIVITNKTIADVIPEEDITVANIAATLILGYLMFLIAFINDQTQTNKQIKRAATKINKYGHWMPLRIAILNAA